MWGSQLRRGRRWLLSGAGLANLTAVLVQQFSFAMKRRTTPQLWHAHNHNSPHDKLPHAMLQTIGPPSWHETRGYRADVDSEADTAHASSRHPARYYGTVASTCLRHRKLRLSGDSFSACTALERAIQSAPWLTLILCCPAVL